MKAAVQAEFRLFGRIKQRGDWYIAYCPPLDLTTQGKTLEEARQNGDIPADSDPSQMANLLVDCWEGAALRSRLRREAAPLNTMLDFYFRSAVAR